MVIEEVDFPARYPEVNNLEEDEIFIEGANMYRGEMPHEEYSAVKIGRVIKRKDLSKLAKEYKEKYGVNRFNEVYIEK